MEREKELRIKLFGIYGTSKYQTKKQNAKKGKNRKKKAAKIFNASIYHYRGLIEGIFGAEEIKHHQSYCRFRLKNNQKRFGLIKINRVEPRSA